MENVKRMKEFLEAKEESKFIPLLRVGNLQTFAAKGDEDEEGDEDEGGDDEDEDEDDEEGSSPSLEEMLKDNPKLKKQYGDLFKKQFNDRLKGLDLKEARKAMKTIADQEAAKDKKAGDDKKDEAKDDAKVSKFENRLKRTAVKEYAIDNGLNPKLLSRLVNLGALDLDDDGELDPTELEEAVEAVLEEFPDQFRKGKDEDDDEDEAPKGGKGKARSHTGLSKKKSNTPKAKDLRQAGANKALERAKAKGLIKE